MLNEFKQYLLGIGKSENTALNYCDKVKLYFKWCRDSFGSEPQQLYLSLIHILGYIHELVKVEGLPSQNEYLAVHIATVDGLEKDVLPEGYTDSGETITARTGDISSMTVLIKDGQKFYWGGDPNQSQWLVYQTAVDKVTAEDWGQTTLTKIVVPEMCIRDRVYKEQHEHVWAEDWTSDGTHHWKACTAEGCAEKDQYGVHPVSYTHLFTIYRFYQINARTF